LKKIILFFVSVLLSLSFFASAGGGSDFGKRKYRKGVFAENLKKLKPACTFKSNPGIKHGLAKKGQYKLHSGGLGLEPKEKLIVFLSILLLSLIQAGIIVLVSATPLSFGLVYLICVGLWLVLWLALSSLLENHC
jgi:hypothetical protein